MATTDFYTITKTIVLYIPNENLLQVAPIHFFPFPIPLEMYILEHKIIVVQLGEIYYLCYQCQATTDQLNDTKCQNQFLREDL